MIRQTFHPGGSGGSSWVQGREVQERFAILRLQTAISSRGKSAQGTSAGSGVAASVGASPLLQRSSSGPGASGAPVG